MGGTALDAHGWMANHLYGGSVFDHILLKDKHSIFVFHFYNIILYLLL